jgi:hypothetical protein
MKRRLRTICFLRSRSWLASAKGHLMGGGGLIACSMIARRKQLGKATVAQVIDGNSWTDLRLRAIIRRG